MRRFSRTGLFRKTRFRSTTNVLAVFTIPHTR